jgi:adenylylsulfate kinase
VSQYTTGGPGLAVWFTGLSGAGKTTLCHALADTLQATGLTVAILDGDEMRRTVCSDLGYGREDREENIRRIASIAQGMVASGTVVLVAAISPYRAMRAEVRHRIRNFVEVYVNAPLATCVARDPKGLYRRALAFEIDSFTGISSPYEPPLAPEIECRTGEESVQASTARLIADFDRLWKLRPEVSYAGS